MDEMTASSRIGPHDLITETQVKDALKGDRGCGAKLVSWNIEDFTKKGDNIATVVTSVKVTFSQKEEMKNVSYVVKLNPCLNAEEMKFATSKIFIKESRFYRELVPDLNSILESAGQPPLRIPKCFHFSLESGKELIFLQDMRPLGFRMTEPDFIGIDFDHMILILKELARYHSASWVLMKTKTLQALSDQYGFLKLGTFALEEAESQHFNEMMTKGNNATITMLEHVGGYNKAVDWIKRHRTSSLEIMINMLLSSPPYDVVCHGDIHSNNTLFRYNDDGKPVEVMLLDHQVNRIASLGTDLVYLLYTSLTGAVRQPNLDSFLETYFSSFSEVVVGHGEQVPFSPEDLRKEYKNKLRLGLVFATFTSYLVIGGQSEMPDREEFFDNTAKDITEKEEKRLLNNFDKNHGLRKKFLDVFDEMTEAGLFGSL